MHFTWNAKPQTDGAALEVLKAAIDAAAPHKILFNCGAFYGPQHDPWANMRLMRNFFDRYPDAREKCVVSVKGGMVMSEYIAKGFPGLQASGKLENLRVDLEKIKAELGFAPDLFEQARVAKDVPFEQQIKNLVTLRDEGLFKHISLSEVGEETIRKAASLASIAAVEVEYSVYETSIETNGVLAACEELGLPILAYSPLGKGALGNKIKSRADLDPSDIRLHMDRWSEENFGKNLELAQAIEDLATSKQPAQSAAQLSLAWIISQSKKRLVVPIPGTSKVERVRQNMAAAGPLVRVSPEDDVKIRSILESMGVHGGRYNDAARKSGTLFS